MRTKFPNKKPFNNKELVTSRAFSSTKQLYSIRKYYFTLFKIIKIIKYVYISFLHYDGN